MKKVFANHSEVTHVWAQQKQVEGRAGNIFFRDTTDLYSYGFHYLMAKVHTVKGKRFALVNSYVYSSSTAGHLSDTRSALRGLMPYFEVSDPSDLKKAVADLDGEVSKVIAAALKRKFFADGNGSREVGRFVGAVIETRKNADKLRSLLGKSEMRFPEKEYKAALSHLLKLEIKYNSPERKAKRAKKAAEMRAKRLAWEKKLKEQEKLEAQKSVEALAAFRAGEPFNQYAINGDYDLVRVKGSRVETSRGAIVPLVAAKALLEKIANFEEISGLTIGSYTVDGIEYSDDTETDSVIRIGCHRILLSEARAVLADAPALALVR